MVQTVRISEKSDAIIEELSSITGKSKISIIEIALEEYRYQERMRLYNQSYEKMRKNKNIWEEEMKERRELDGTLNDGMENESSTS